MLQTRSVKCASIAGVTRKLLCTLQKLYHAKCNASAAFRLSSFLLKAFVSLVKRRMCILIVRFCRSTKDVEIWSGSGLPERTLDINLHDWTWGVPPGGVMLPVIAKQLFELGEVHVQSERIRNGTG
jgi:hypothetical protein